MSTPSPFTPGGRFLDQDRSRARARFKVLIFSVVALHLVLLNALLIQGCKRSQTLPDLIETVPTNAASALPTNAPAPGLPLSTSLEIPVLPVVPQSPVGSEPTEAPSPAPNVATKDYRVANGDTLAKIAKRCGVSLAELTQANPDVNPLKLRVGQALQLPEKAGRPAAAKTPSAPMQPGELTYTVKNGDTLAKIAKVHGTTAPAIRRLNHLNTDRLMVGKQLKLPVPASRMAGASERSQSTNSPNIFSTPGTRPSP